MRLHSGIGGPHAGVQCRVLVGGLGIPGLRDLDFGRQVVGYLQALDWPEEVVIEDLSCSAHLALHRLQELRPAKVVLMASAARGADQPGTLRRYRLDLTPPAPDDVHQGLVETLGGMPDLDHTLAVVRHWGGFPADTVVIEVEPSDCSFGPGFSEELGECMEPILAMVREELGCEQESADPNVELSVEEFTSRPSPSPGVSDCDPEQPSDGLLAMAEYAREHERQRLVQPYRDGSSAKRWPLPSGVDFSALSKPWAVGLGAGSNWHEFIPMRSGKVALVIGNVPGRGVEAVATMSEVRTAARAYALLEDDSPGHLVSRLDWLVEVTGLGKLTALTSLVLTPETGEVRFSNAGACPLLVLAGDGTVAFVEEGASPPLGAGHDGERPEAMVRLAPESTLLLFTEGLVHTPKRTVGQAMAQVVKAAGDAPRPLEALCEGVLAACLDDVERDDDVLLLALRLAHQDSARDCPSPTGCPPV